MVAVALKSAKKRTGEPAAMTKSFRFSTTLAICGLAVGGLAGCEDENADPAIYDVEPRMGSIAGGQPVRIVGAHFRPDIGYRVYFGNKRSDNVTVLDESTLAAATPEHEEPGPVEIIVLADNGPAYKITGGFAYRDESQAAEAAQKAKGNLAY